MSDRHILLGWQIRIYHSVQSEKTIIGNSSLGCLKFKAKDKYRHTILFIFSNSDGQGKIILDLKIKDQLKEKSHAAGLHAQSLRKRLTV